MFRLRCILCCVLATFLVNQAFGQKQAEPKVAAFQIGSGLALGVRVPGDTLLLGGKPIPGVSGTITRKPVMMLSYDYLVTQRFSMGGLFGYQQLHIHSTDSLKKLFEAGNVNRFYLGFRGLWHFAKNEKVDLYAGFKLGALVFKTGKIEKGHTQKSEIESKNNRGRMAVGLIPIGARFYLSNQIGINIETSIGSPAFMCAGINYRF